MHPYLRLWRLAFAVSALSVLTLSLLPLGPHAPSTGWDKANHLLAFMALGWLGCMAWPQRMATVLVALVVYGALIELLQSFTSYRLGEWGDLLADALGLLAGGAMAVALQFFNLRRPRASDKL